jgi:hypothetical protein
MLWIKLLACLGIVWIIKDSYIFSKPRSYLKSKSPHLEKFLSCSLCLGFWVGLFLLFSEFYFTKTYDYNYFLIPFSVSAFCWFIDSILDAVQELYVYYKNIRESNEK